MGVKVTIFGTQQAAAAAITRRGGSGTQTIPKDGSIQVRFLTEPDEWAKFDEVWDPSTNRTRPVLEGEQFGDDPDRRPTVRILASVILRDGDRGDRVVPLKMPRSLAKSLLNRGERYGTVTDRDYVLSRTGSGLGTEYDVDAEPPSAVNLGKYEKVDLVAVLNAEADYASAVTPQRPAPAPTVDEDDDEIVDDVPVLDDDEVADDTDDEVVAASPTSDDDEEVELTIDDLRSMSVAELKALAAELGVAIVPNMKKAALIEQVWEAI